MKSRNFEFLRSDYRELANLGGFAESYAYSDHASCLVKLRLFAEHLVKSVFAQHRLERFHNSNFNDLLNDDSFKSITPAVVLEKLHLIRIKGNHAAHGTLYKFTDEQVVEIVKNAWGLGQWLVLSQGKLSKDQLPVWQSIAPSAEDSKAAIKREKKAALIKLAQQEAQMAKLLEELEKTRAKAEAAAKSKEEQETLLKQAQHAANSLDFSEEKTRYELIDEHLRAAGWKVGSRGTSNDEVGQEIDVLHQPTTSGIGRADYVLYGDNGKPLAVVEAKKTAVDAARGKKQAQLYADGLQKMHGGFRPIIFYTNGYEIFIWDDAKTETPRSLFGFYSRESLEYAHFQTENREPVLGTLNPKESITDRLYQIEAIKRVAECFDDRRRKALIIQATGTGKTRVAIALTEVMIRAKWAKRILFLCDRKELRKQAADAFDEFLPNEPRVIVSRSTSGDGTKRIYLATYPAMMKCFQNFDTGFFDLIIADESHRSIYNRYRDLFRWFDARQVGLTATPIQFVHRNTYKLFTCENEDPTANFTYEEAIAHNPPYLSPFTVTKHTTKFLRDGLKYKDLTPEQREQLEEQVEDSESIDFDKEKVSREVFNRDTDRAIVRNLMENGIRNADGTHLGKSIVFARNHRHAKQLVEVFDELYPQYGGEFCSLIDNYEPRAEQLIDDFKSTDGSKKLTIAVSVDMLDTGIDVPEVVNLVFAKPVKSYAKFWQMVGRGTRLCKDLFGQGKDKTEFRIFDHWGNFEYFDLQKKEAEPARIKSLTEQVFEARIDLGEAAIANQDLESLKLATSLLKADVSALPSDCLSVRERWKDVHGIQADGVIDDFDKATVAVLRTVIAPLMQWRDVRKREAALGFDILMAKLLTARLTGSAEFEDHRDTIIAQVSSLPINLRPVQEKLPYIQKAKQTAIYKTASVAEIEELRENLRGIMHNRKVVSGTPLEPLFLDVAEEKGEYQTSAHKVKLSGMDLAAYRNRVEGILKELFEESSALQKIRKGQPVAEEDLNQLVSDVLVRDPDLHLEELLEHFPNKSKSLALAIRRVVGMEAEAVDESFKLFVQEYPSLNSNQIRFLEMLKAQVANFGVIELEKLWESPFTTIHSQGIDGVFTDEKQVDALLDLLNKLNQSAA